MTQPPSLHEENEIPCSGIVPQRPCASGAFAFPRYATMQVTYRLSWCNGGMTKPRADKQKTGRFYYQSDWTLPQNDEDEVRDELLKRMRQHDVHEVLMITRNDGLLLIK